MRFAATLLPSVALAGLLLVETGGASQPGEVRIVSVPYRPPESPTLSVETNLVEVAVTVRDRGGKAVGGLTRDDFQILDRRRPQRITFFSEERAEGVTPVADNAAVEQRLATTASLPPDGPLVAPHPRSLALFFDDTHSGVGGFDRARRAAQKLIADGLRPGDRVGIFTASGSVTVDFTADAKSLLAALAALRRYTDQGVRGFRDCPKLTAYQAYAIATRMDPRARDIAALEVRACAPQTPWEEALQIAQAAGDSGWDYLRPESFAALDTLANVVHRLSAAPGTRVLLMISPGFVTAGMEQRRSAITDACLRSHIVINALDDEGLAGSGADLAESLGAPAGPRAEWAARTSALRNQVVTAFLADAAAATGGRFLHNTNDLEGSLRTLSARPEISYLLGFQPSGKPDGTYHELKVTVAHAGAYAVSARPGYFAAPAEPVETAQQRIDRAVASGDSLDQLAATVKVSAAPADAGHCRIQVVIALDARQLPFRVRDGASLQQITFVTVLEDTEGRFLRGKQSEMELSLSSATLASMRATGLKAAASFMVPKGAYRIREVVREAVQNRLAASTTAVEAR